MSFLVELTHKHFNYRVQIVIKGFAVRKKYIISLNRSFTFLTARNKDMLKNEGINKKINE